jgi:uncharacterized Tic20 family protein
MNETVARPDRTWDVIAHLSALVGLLGVPFGNVLGPLVVWLMRKDSDPSGAAHSKEALNFQISVALYLVIAAAVTASLMLILIGVLLLPLLIAAVVIVPLIDLILVIVAAIKASNGELYRYPLTLRLIR